MAAIGISVPPIIIATNPKVLNVPPRYGLAKVRGATSTPAIPARNPEIAKVTTATTVMLTPMAPAISGSAAVAIAIIGLWHTRAKARRAGGDRFYRVATWAVLFGPIGAGFGWIFTEVGRRPGSAVYEVLGIRHANTPTMAADTMWVSLIVLTLLYALLAVVEVGLMLRTVRRGPAADVPGRDVGDSRPEPELGFAY